MAELSSWASKGRTLGAPMKGGFWAPFPRTIPQREAHQPPGGLSGEESEFSGRFEDAVLKPRAGAHQTCSLPSRTPRDSESRARGLGNLGFLPQRILLLGIPGLCFGTPRIPNHPGCRSWSISGVWAGRFPQGQQALRGLPCLWSPWPAGESGPWLGFRTWSHSEP